MTREPEISRVGQVVLLRLLAGAEGGTNLAQVRKDLGPLFDAGSAEERIERAIDLLVVDELVERTSVRRCERLVLRPEGRRRALALLGVESLPPRTTWATLKKSRLPALALGDGSAAKDLSKDADLKAELMRRVFGLTLGERPRSAEVSDALAWKLLGIDSAQKFTVANVKSALFRRALGTGQPVTPSQGVDRLLAQRLGAKRPTGAELRDAAVRAWLGGESEGREATDATATVEPESTARPPGHNGHSAASPPRPGPAPNLADFTLRVLRGAERCPTGRFGDNKVFIAHVWRFLRDDPAFASLDLDGFKRRLVEANRQRLLDLSRADLVEAMDPADLSESVVHHVGATFHFIRLPRPEDS